MESARDFREATADVAGHGRYAVSVRGCEEFDLSVDVLLLHLLLSRDGVDFGVELLEDELDARIVELGGVKVAEDVVERVEGLEVRAGLRVDVVLDVHVDAADGGFEGGLGVHFHVYLRVRYRFQVEPLVSSSSVRFRRTSALRCAAHEGTII